MQNQTGTGKLDQRRDAVQSRGENAALTTPLSAVRSVNAQKADSERISGLQTRLSLALEIGQIGVWEWDFMTNAVSWDARMYEIYGIPHATPITFELWKSAIHPEDVTLASGVLSKHVQQGLRGQHRFRVLHPSKGVRLHEAFEQLVLDSAGNPIACFGVDRDVTETHEIGKSPFRRRTELEKLTRTDPLTGVGNRRRLDEELPKEIGRVRRYGGKLSLMMVDVDHLKQVNDRFGHQAGDAALRIVVRTIESEIRDADWIARFGGDEFCVVLPQTGVQGAQMTAERVRQKLQKTTVAPMAGPVTASFGLVELADRESAGAFLERADQGLYRAKNAGRNLIVINRDDRPADLLQVALQLERNRGRQLLRLENPFSQGPSSPVPYN